MSRRGVTTGLCLTNTILWCNWTTLGFDENIKALSGEIVSSRLVSHQKLINVLILILEKLTYKGCNIVNFGLNI